MKLDIVIPSLNRQIKLENCIESIKKTRQDYDVQVYLYFSVYGEFEYFSNKYKEYWINCKRVANYQAPIFWNNHLKGMVADVMLCCNDDVLFKDDTIEKIYEHYPKSFSDFDGVMGINQENIPKEKALESAFSLIGKKYADRFPNRKVYCPQYYRFYGDRELMDYALRINKFVYCPEIKIIHLHPQFDESQRDETHKKAREYLAIDNWTYNKRKSIGMIWGDSWDILKEVK